MGRRRLLTYLWGFATPASSRPCRCDARPGRPALFLTELERRRTAPSPCSKADRGEGPRARGSGCAFCRVVDKEGRGG